MGREGEGRGHARSGGERWWVGRGAADEWHESPRDGKCAEQRTEEANTQRTGRIGANGAHMAFVAASKALWSLAGASGERSDEDATVDTMVDARDVPRSVPYRCVLARARLSARRSASAFSVLGAVRWWI